MEALKALINKMNERGIPLPVLKDSTGKGSYTLTMYVVSFTVCILALAGKFANVVGPIDFSNCLALYVACTGAYLGRKMQKGKDGSVSLDGEEKKVDNDK